MVSEALPFISKTTSDLVGGKQPATVAGAVLFLVKSLQAQDTSGSFQSICSITGTAPATTRNLYIGFLWPNRESIVPVKYFQHFGYSSPEQFSVAIGQLTREPI